MFVWFVNVNRRFESTYIYIIRYNNVNLCWSSRDQWFLVPLNRSTKRLNLSQQFEWLRWPSYWYWCYIYLRYTSGTRPSYKNRFRFPRVLIFHCCSQLNHFPISLREQNTCIYTNTHIGIHTSISMKCIILLQLYELTDKSIKPLIYITLILFIFNWFHYSQRVNDICSLHRRSLFNTAG